MFFFLVWSLLFQFIINIYIEIDNKVLKVCRFNECDVHAHVCLCILNTICALLSIVYSISTSTHTNFGIEVIRFLLPFSTMTYVFSLQFDCLFYRTDFPLFIEIFADCLIKIKIRIMWFMNRQRKYYLMRSK